MGLCQKILGNRDIRDIMIRLETLEGIYEKGTIILIGLEKNKTRPTVKTYQNEKESQKEDLNKYTLAITYTTRTSEYELHTEEQEQEQKGWTITGKNANGQEIQANYQTLEQMMNERITILKQIGGYAIIHEYGTTKYRIIEVGPPL